MNDNNKKNEAHNPNNLVCEKANATELTSIIIGIVQAIDIAHRETSGARFNSIKYRSKLMNRSNVRYTKPKIKMEQKISFSLMYFIVEELMEK